MNKGGKLLGNFLTEEENELPEEMSCFTSRMTTQNTWSSVWSCNASSDCTNGRPAVSSDASCWVKIASSPSGSPYFLAFRSSDFCRANVWVALKVGFLPCCVSGRSAEDCPGWAEVINGIVLAQKHAAHEVAISFLTR